MKTSQKQLKFPTPGKLYRHKQIDPRNDDIEPFYYIDVHGDTSSVANMSKQCQPGQLIMVLHTKIDGPRWDRRALTHFLNDRGLILEGSYFFNEEGEEEDDEECFGWGAWWEEVEL